MNTNSSHRGFPMNLTFTYAHYFYSQFYCGHLAASANDTTNKDKGCSLFDGARFGSIGGGTMLAFDSASTPSVGWMSAQETL